MEGICEEVIADDVTGSAQLQAKSRDDHLNVLDSQVICASLRNERPSESSTHDYIDSGRHVNEDSPRYIILPGSQPGRTTPCSITNAENLIELTVRNYGSPSLSLVGNRFNFRRGKWQHHASDMPTGSKYKGVYDTKEISASCMRTSDKLIISRCKLPDKDTLTTLVTSSSSRLLADKALKGKGTVGNNGDAHGDGKPGYDRKVASDALMKASVKRNQFSSHKVIGSSPEAITHGTTLSNWLKPGSCRRDKVESLIVFRQVVELVDLAHSQGVVLQDLQPSCFKILSSNKVAYAGSVANSEPDRTVSLGMHKKRPAERDPSMCVALVAKQQKLDEYPKFVGQKSQSASSCRFKNMAMGERDFHANDAQYSPYSTVPLSKKWYRSPEQLNGGTGTFSSNIYSLGVLLFELLNWFESYEMHSTVMLDLLNRILPASFLSENPKEAGFCLWLLHPEPSSRPTARQILESELLRSHQESCTEDDASTFPDDTDGESELLLHFLSLLSDQKEAYASKLIEGIGCLEEDIKEVEKRHLLRTSSGTSQKDMAFPDPFSISRPDNASNMNDTKWMRHIKQIGDAYFFMRPQVCRRAATSLSRKHFLKSREMTCVIQSENKESNTVQKFEDPLGAFLDGFCKFARYSKFEECGSLKNRNLMSSANVLCSLSFDRDEEYIAVAGISKKIKVFDFAILVDDSIDIHYPVVEMSNKSNLSCISWNNYVKNYLASTDYDGVIQMWDAGTGQGVSRYAEHQKRAWSVDFSLADPLMFASGSDDCSVKLWSINERGSLGTILNPANVCCVQFSVSSSHLLAYGSADYKISCYDLRHTRMPWCTLSGHEKAVSYVKFLDSHTIVSASTDNSLKLWDLDKTSSTGLSSGACLMSFRGHTNEKNFVGLSTLDGYIACGSETNEVYCYYRSLPMPITSYKFGYVDPFSGDKIVDNSGQFVSSVCWRKKSNMVVAANSMGNMKVLKMV